MEKQNADNSSYAILQAYSHLLQDKYAENEVRKSRKTVSNANTN